MKKLKEDLHLWIAQEMIKSSREGTFIFLHMVQKTKQLFCFRYSDICIHHLLYSTTCFSENSVLVPVGWDSEVFALQSQRHKNSLNALTLSEQTKSCLYAEEVTSQPLCCPQLHAAAFYWRNLDDVGTVQWCWWIKTIPTSIRTTSVKGKHDCRYVFVLGPSCAFSMRAMKACTCTATTEKESTVTDYESNEDG